MSPAEARQVLAAWRDGLGGKPDPEVLEALALAGRDPELAAWWNAQQAFHRGTAAALRAAPPPADLAERILAARKVRPAEFSPRPRASAWLAAAAAVAVLAGGLWVTYRPRPVPMAGFDVFRSPGDGSPPERLDVPAAAGRPHHALRGRDVQRH